MSSQTIAPSPPASPTEEDISRAGVYADSEAGASTATLTGKTAKQKQKQRADGPFADDSEDSSQEEGSPGRAGSYPPRNDEDAESRRIAENLRRWEIAERQRRKAARDSSSTVASTSLVGDVTRKASLLWPARRTRQATQGVGTHQIIPSSEEGVAMDEMENDIPLPVTAEPENPFTTPMASTVSLNAPDDSAIMTESSESTLKDLSDSQIDGSDAKLSRSQSRSHPPPPPQPLDLPKPRTPPPRSGTPHVDRPPEPIPPPILSQNTPESDMPEKRWWTDWLCGCREHGDNQAGRTNPFE